MTFPGGLVVQGGREEQRLINKGKGREVTSQW